MTDGMKKNLPSEVILTKLQPHDDDRGTFTELFRREWAAGVEPIQWNAVRSRPRVLRGVHCHWRHDDYLLPLQGRLSVGLCDLRPWSSSYRRAACVELHAAKPYAITIPHGVAHGFYFHEPSVHVYAVSHYWDHDDELGCRWDDADLGIPWPMETALVSPRDHELPSLRELERQLVERRAAEGEIVDGKKGADASFPKPRR